MNIADVVTLARAGFTADQIARMYATPAPVAQVAPAPNNPVMEQLKLLTNTLQANAILNSNQPKQETVDDILASIINPTKAN